ncbi:FAD-dependent monooxygenase [Pareuzebyella sediminis]|uniref:FAD-dependent monooxygenase n=1 Tax=Pareuzebyella sediminis TaxID=2607998 RepID=UPI0011EE72EC|nr:FAD-dependent monooxygenase [Pareuzebyella sediminis]
MEKTVKTQVVIVGAGPTGLALACQLFRYGVDFIIIERNHETTNLSKAMVVHARSMEVFDEIGLAETFIAEGQITKRVNMMSNGKIAERLKLEEFGKGLTKFPYILTIEQSKTEKIMVDFLEGSGVQILWGNEFLGLENHEQHVAVKYKDRNGKTIHANGDYVIGCDGASSAIRHHLEIPFIGDTVSNTFYVADVEMSSPVINRKEGYINMIPDGFVLMFGMPGKNRYRIIGVLPDDEGADHPTFDLIKNTIGEQIKTSLTIEKEYWFSTYKVNSRMATTFKKERCFLLGDAAHIHSPAGGQGMNTGIQDAYNLAWKLSYVLSGKASDTLLESYDEERKANARNLLKSTDKAFEFIMGESQFINSLKLHVFPYVAKVVTETHLGRKKFFPFLSQLAISYQESSLTIKSRVGKVKAGDRMPFFEFKDGENIYDKINRSTYKLLFFGMDNGLSPFENSTSTLMLHIIEIPKIFEHESNFFVHLRPDNHITYLGKDLNVINKLLFD